MVRQDKIASLRFGRRIVIPVKAVEKLIEDAIASNELPQDDPLKKRYPSEEVRM